MTYWKPVSKTALITGLAAAGIFWLHAIMDDDGFLFFDYVNLPFHEFGHLFFAPFGETLSMLGGTIMQCAIPFGIMLNFLYRAEPAGFAFSGFWLGENFLNISVYVADARKMELPLVGGGEHDWNILLSKFGLLNSDAFIARLLSTSGWIVMICFVAWFIWQGLSANNEQNNKDTGY
ncbi:MAG: hypothetical protein LLF86_06275 [Nitrospiraceae bacterium]|nr:hypothetical protein [Nitrospiraceae bacterium]